jgi:predicted DNA-binding protein YlxM (UPF0122 family)
MTIDELKHDFENYTAAVALVKSKMRGREELRNMMSAIKSGLNTDGMPHAHCQEPDKTITDIVSKLEVIKKALIESLSKSVKMRMRVESYLALLSDKPKQEAVLRLYYIDGLSMEDVSRKIKNVPGVMHYSKAQCWRYYNQAFDEIFEKLKKLKKRKDDTV